MAHFRRVYVYLICTISLVVVAISLVNVLEIATHYVWGLFRSDALIDEPASEIRRNLSLFLALLGVSLPIFALHAYLAERWARSGGLDSDRFSRSRGLYFTAVLSVSLLIFGMSLISMIETAISSQFESWIWISPLQVVISMLVVLVTGSIWAGHAWMRHRDMTLVDLPWTSNVPVRIYFYGALFISGILLMIGTAQILRILVEQLVINGTGFFSFSWADREIALPIAFIAVGAVVWSLHWSYRRRAHVDPGWQSSVRRGSRLRLTYMYLIMLVAFSVSVVALSITSGELLRPLIGPSVSALEDPFLSSVLTPVAFVASFGAFWLFHRRTMFTESRDLSQPEVIEGEARLEQYMLALVGFVVGAIGLGYLAGATVEYLFDAVGFEGVRPDWFPDRTSLFVALLLVGAIVWLPIWRERQKKSATEPVSERQSHSRRAYLYLTLSFSTLALLVSLSTILYQVLQVILNVRPSAGLSGDVAALLGVSLVGGVSLAYHVRCLIRDSRYIGEVPVPETPVEALLQPSFRMTFTLTGPDEPVLRDLAREFQASLPETVLMEHLRVDKTQPEGSALVEHPVPKAESGSDLPITGPTSLTPERPS
jgi:hypothetical protein